METGISAPAISSDSSESAASRSAVGAARALYLPWVATAVFFGLLFGKPIYFLARDWWTVPEAGHGLLLAPVAIWFAWKSGLLRDATPNTRLGVTMLVAAVLGRFASGMAAELFTMRASMVLSLGGIVVFHRGLRQLLHWWLPFLL